MARSETASLIVSLIDKVTGPARAASASIRGIADAARAADGTAMGRLNAAIATNNRALDVMRGRMVEAVAGFIGLREALRAPVSAAMGFETMLEDIGQKAGLSGAPLAALGQQIREVARQTNLSATEMGKSIDAVIGLGLNAPDALAIAPSIGKVAVAYRAAADDVGRAGVAALQNLKVAPTEIMAAFDAMAKAGKEGAFELKDMAQYFPQLTAQAQNLGIVGVKGVADLAAALQITRRGAGDASEAATNLRNVLQKIESPATRKNFKKFGIDVSKEVAAGLKAGVSPIETIANLTKRAMEKGAKLSDLFEDAQVQSGLLALMQNIEEYRRIRSEAMKASGMVEEDFQRRIKTSAAAVARFQASIENLNIAIGTALLPGLTQLTDLLGEHANEVATLAEKYPAVTRSVVALTAGLMGLKVAGTAVAYGARLAWGGLLMVAKGALLVAAPFMAMGRAAAGAIALQRALGAMSGLKLGFFGTIATGLRGIVAALPVVGAALAGVTAPVAATIAAVVAAVAAGAILIWKYWDRIVAVASGIAARLGEALAPVAGAIQPYLQPVLDYLGNMASWIGEKLAPIGSVIMEGLGSVGRWISELLTPERLDASGKADWAAWGYNLADGLVNSVMAKVNELVAWFSGLPGRIMAAVGSIDIGSLIKWPTLPSWLGGGGAQGGAGAASASSGSTPTSEASSGSGGAPSATSTPKVEGARAWGGPVKADATYLVGEQGPEFFTPDRGGTIVPNHELGQAPKPSFDDNKGQAPIFNPAQPQVKVNVASAGDKTPQPRSTSVSLAPTFQIQGGNSDEIVTKVMAELERMVRGAQRDLLGDYGLDPA